jgi:carbon monoxide dehydrogenase subunit G
VIVGLGLAAALAATPLPSSTWQDQDTQQRLRAGEVVVRSQTERDSHTRVEAAVRIHAPAPLIWAILSDCERAADFIPGLKHCHRIDGAADGSWELIEHEVKLTWLMPTIRSVFRIDNERPRRIDFHRVSGDLKDETGAWVLEPGDNGTTTVEYQLDVDPGYWVPFSLVRHMLRKELPAALLALRARAEQLQSAAPATSTAAAPQGQGP